MKKTLITLCAAVTAFLAFIWNAQAAYTDDCITFSSAASFTLKTYNTSKNWDGTLWTSTDKTNWTEWNGALVSATQTGGTYHLYVRGNTSNMKISGNYNCRWTFTGSAGIDCTGNIETLRGATGNAPSPTKMADDCYSYMFYVDDFDDCAPLTAAPALPATMLAEGCYCYMFADCTSLEAPPALPATTLADACYGSMFVGCTSLTDVPALPATTLADYCYNDMFRDCASLKVNATAPGREWKIPVKSTTAVFWGTDMFWSTGGTLQEQPELNTTYYIASAPPAPNNDCIAFSSAASFTLKTNNGAKNWDSTLWSSTDKINWTVWRGGEISAAQAGGTYNLYVRGNTSNTKITGNGSDCRWVLTGGNIACTGNIETLRGATGNDPSPTWMANGCYSNMFFGCTALTEAPALPATIPKASCYAYMFSGCTALTNAPALPATTLANSCYFAMFLGCTSLTAAPALPAMYTAKTSCYAYMFSGCTSLVDVPELPATSLETACYYKMFEGCTSLMVNAAAPGREWKIPATWTYAWDWGYNMFTGTSGTLQGQPALNTAYYIASAPQEPVEPGGEIVVPEGKAEEKAAEINGDPAVKAQYLKAPEGVETTADYLGCFDAVATSGSTVAFVLNEKGTNEVAAATEAVNTAALDTVFSEESTMTIDKPLVGFYYSFKQGGDVSVGDQADLNKLGGRDTISFELTKGPLQYFYQTLVTPQPTK